MNNLSTYVNVWPDKSASPVTVNREYIPLLVAFGLVFFDYKYMKTFTISGYQNVTAEVIERFVAMWESPP